MSRVGTRMHRALFALALVLSGLAFAPRAKSREKRFRDMRTPSAGPAESIGGYSAGCVRGASMLPLRGPGYRVVKPARRRHFGHPALVSFVRDLGKGMQEKGLGMLLVGDLGQPRGGPAPNGHASHQSGLDVDLWYWAPEDAAALNAKALAGLEPPSLVEGGSETVTSAFGSRTVAMLQLAAADPRVARIFVNPVIKQALCKESAHSRVHLMKLRPWWGHDQHFHVRLACPEGSAQCEPQAPIAEGDGCEELARWIGPDAAEKQKAERARYRAKVGAEPSLPPACSALLE